MSDDENGAEARADEPVTKAIPKSRKPSPKVPPRKIPPRLDTLPPQARPQRIEPSQPERVKRSSSGRRWVMAFVGALVVIVAAGAVAFAYMSRDRGSSEEAQIRSSIETFTQALTTGDLATLRSSTCGDLATFYRDIPDAEFADVHRVAVEQGSIPVVQSIDAVQITDDTAIAQVTAYTAANAADRSPRTFDLRLEGESWKMCG
ncbi:hypothetical protein HQ346_11400 [Rhodococcus sp. BP-252]|uniref:Rv0361 family membrane protein n=1 Tax=Nocardiaceae TaxID=85025 RepID=UPI000AFD3EB7|nr:MULTISPECIES: hypothetical protein [Rhodococcus]MBY6412573.1 hypothetical protein [Rhodococcus sp. BP-320]MBY6417172.1 hypothetical protein [Rhodococcus sp. BP-321]MBY6424543.1 hypothetical protein [Rhodococcus sp. BP-324]MBY6427196.1 hypothetical protein [Rhodococcus sp. BP-323]MBY6432191.1 hypothetical protein [Rhodococcus sp. BP-322]